MSNADLLKISDGLRTLRHAFGDYRHGGVTMSADAVDALWLRLAELEADSRTLENELSRSRWNDLARSEETARTSLVLREAMKPGSNIRFLNRDTLPLSDGGRR